MTSPIYPEAKRLDMRLFELIRQGMSGAVLYAMHRIDSRAPSSRRGYHFS
jgi:hypothetical protein